MLTRRVEEGRRRAGRWEGEGKRGEVKGNEGEGRRVERSAKTRD